MRRDLFEGLRCPHCRERLNLEEFAGDSQAVLSGTLSCARCGILVPIERGFPFFTLADVTRRDPLPLLGSDDEYETYMERKLDRGEIEMYAAFHPFNESFRAIEPLLAAASLKLKPGDVILEPWARTGWTAAWLAARLPEQRIIALWEGDTSVLGYRGFAHWFAEGSRPVNLHVMFVHPERGLPFADGSIAAVISHDCFHRFGVETFGGELLRVAAADAPIVLAHVHLSNSEPDPWFERGGTIRHGRDYREWLDRVTANSSRTGRIWSEGDLFRARELPPDDPDTTHYNGLVFLAENVDAGRPKKLSKNGEERLLLNPLYQLHGGRSVARIDRNHLDGLVGHMLDRHPVYRPVLAREPLPLSDAHWLILIAAMSGTSVGLLPEKTGIEADLLTRALEHLRSFDLLLQDTASDAMLHMQRFHCNQLPRTNHFRDLNTIRIDSILVGRGNFELSGEEIRASLEIVAAAMNQLGVGAGTRLQIGGSDHPLVLLIMLAALTLGSDVELGGDDEQLILISGEGRRHIPFGWDSADDGFITMLESVSPKPLQQVDDRARLYFPNAGERAGVTGSSFLEAAASLKHSLARPHSVDTLKGVSEWLTATSGLLAGGKVRLG